MAYSAGTHKLAKYLQKTGSKSPLVAAVTVSGVLDLQNTYSDVYKNENRLYKVWHYATLVYGDNIESYVIAGEARLTTFLYIANMHIYILFPVNLYRYGWMYK